MQFRHILITGGAGFVGSNLACRIREGFPGVTVDAVDNLKRRGSPLNLAKLDDHGVRFTHADIRCREDLTCLNPFDLLIDCSAEPSASSGLDGSPDHVLQTNLAGTLQCLELARQREASFLFLSSSRVYPLARLNDIPFDQDETRFRWRAPDSAGVAGLSERGISEAFSLDGPRSLYGTTKLAAELVIGEFGHLYGLRTLINRCGLLAGPGQMSRVDQGVVTRWLASHYYRRPLSYIGFGGTGHQVRDVLHIDDLCDLVLAQLNTDQNWNGTIYNVGGGPDRAVSLIELTRLCESMTGNRLEIDSVPDTNPTDVRIFLTDSSRAEQAFDWRPTRTVTQVLRDTREWIDATPDALRTVIT